MLYGGLMGSPLIRGLMEPMDIAKVHQFFQKPKEIHPLLRR